MKCYTKTDLSAAYVAALVLRLRYNSVVRCVEKYCVTIPSLLVGQSTI
jgi:hypothetical protein